MSRVRGSDIDTSDDQWRQISERIRDDVLDALIANDPVAWAAEWVDVDGSVISYLELVRRSVLSDWDKDAWRRAFGSRLRGRLPR